jgi:hypothetical protein
VVHHNAFVGYSGNGSALYLDEGTTSLTSAAQLDALQLQDQPTCGEGGNLAFVDAATAGLLSLDSSSANYLRPASDSPLVEAGQDLPYLCNAKIVLAHDLDFEGQSIPCRMLYDIGYLESCP